MLIKKNIYFLFILSIILLFSCSKTEKTTVVENPNNIPVVETKSSEDQSSSKTVCIFTDGNVEYGRDGNFSVLEIGTELNKNDIIRTLEGSCEILFGNAATLVVRSHTTISINSAIVSGDKVHIDATVNSGEVLNKVKTLAGIDSFTIRTQEGICGVRGTEFVVSCLDNESLVAVKSGAVSIIPQNKIVDSLASASQTNLLANLALNAIVKASPIVKAGQELTINKEHVEEAKQVYEQIASKLSLEDVAKSDNVAEIILNSVVDYSKLDEAKSSEIKNTAAQIKNEKLIVSSASKNTEQLFNAFDIMTTPGSKNSVSPLPEIDNLPQIKGPITAIIESPTAKIPSAEESANSDSPVQVTRTNETKVQEKAEYILDQWKISNTAIGGNINRISTNGNIIVCTEDGDINAVSDSGKILWNVPSMSLNANILEPIQYKGNLYYKDGLNFIGLNSETGRKLFTIQGNAKDLISEAQVVQFPNVIVVPLLSGFQTYDPDNGKLITTVSLKGGTSMAPANYKGQVAIVNNKGEFLLVNPDNGEIKITIPTKANIISSEAPRIFNQKAVFCDTSGLVIMVDIEKMEVVWEKSLDLKNAHASIEVGDAGVFVYNQNKIWGIDLKGNGFVQIKNVSCAPLLSKGVLYYGTNNGNFISLDIATGKEKTISLGSVAVSRPLYTNGYVLVGTKSGRLIKIDPTKM